MDSENNLAEVAPAEAQAGEGRIEAEVAQAKDASAPAEASQVAPAGQAAKAGGPTPEQVAERVYELLRRDLRLYRERKGF